MKELFKYAKTDKIIKLSLQASGALLVSEIIYTLVVYLSLPPLVPLFNQLPWGEERLGQRFEIFFPSMVSFVFLLVNLILLNKLYERLPLISRILSITTLLICVLSFIFTIQTLHIIL